MYIELGSPKKLSSLPAHLPNLEYLKQTTKIAIIDDQSFKKVESLRNHGFSLTELGDINSVNQIAEYPVVVCDIRGVGRYLGSDLEGAHLIAEIRKAYPDKFLVSYSGAEFDLRYNQALSSVDSSIAKDSSTEYWVTVLEDGICSVSDPKERWLRIRRRLLDAGLEIHDAFLLEQSFLKAIDRRDASFLRVNGLPPEISPVVRAFANIALVQIIKLLNHG